MTVTLKLIEKMTIDINLKFKLKQIKNNLNKINKNNISQKTKILTGD